MIDGKLIYLKAIEFEDLSLLQEWRNNPQYRKYFREYREINTEMQKNWYQTRVLSDPNTIMFAIHSKETYQTIGCCGLCNINWINRSGEISVYIGDTYLDERASDACTLLIEYAFQILGLHKVWAEVYQLDIKREKMLKNLGFRLDGVQRDHYFYKGKWFGSSLYSLLVGEQDSTIFHFKK